MITLDDARERILAQCRPLGARIRSLQDVAGRVLAQDVRARHDHPRFASSAVDGYAVRSADIAGATADAPVRLRLRGEIRAGDAPVRDGTPGTALRIFTGAPVPPETDAVVMQEDTDARGIDVDVFTACGRGENVRPRAGEFAAGDLMLDAGLRITPPVIGLLAAMGVARIRVFERPRVAVLPTGDELRPVHAPLRAGEIRDSNSPMLRAALQARGIEPFVAPPVCDRLADVTDALRPLLADHDVVITTGGVSVGDHDHVRAAAAWLGVTERFWKVAMKPGKPLFFGTRKRALVFGLPGNPLAALLTFQHFIAPALDALEGERPRPDQVIAARLATAVSKKPGRVEFLRVRLARGADGIAEAVPTRGRESHMLGGIAIADGIFQVPAETSHVEAGAIIPVAPLHWSHV